MIKLAVATPAFGEVFYAPYVRSLLRLQRAAQERNWGMTHSTVSYVYTGDARNYLLTLRYDKTDASHLLFVDADMGFEPQLIFDMVALDKPVTGVIYTKRQVDLQRLAARAAAGEKPERAVAQAHDFIMRPLRGRQPRGIGGFIEVEGCGTGVMLIQRATIDAMLKALPDINDTNHQMTTVLTANIDRHHRGGRRAEAAGRFRVLLPLAGAVQRRTLGLHRPVGDAYRPAPVQRPLQRHGRG